MAVAQGVLANIAYQAYSSGAMIAATEDLAPPVDSAQYLRRVSSNLNLKVKTFAATEIRPDLQIATFRQGGKSVSGDIAGELSPGTWFDFMEAVHRDTRAAGATSSQSALTTMECNAEASTIIFTGGNPVTAGFLVGNIIQLTGATESANDGVNFMITGFGGTTNRTVSVYPPPTNEASASSTFTVTAPGYITKIPLSGQVNRKYGIEIFDTDVAVSRLFTEVRATKYAVNLPTSGLVTTTVTFMGRDMVTGTEQYFSSPTAVTIADITSSTSGIIMVGGSIVGVVTALSLDVNVNGVEAEVAGQRYVADVLLGILKVTGQMTAYLTDTTLLGYLNAETEFQILFQVNSSPAPNAAAMTFFLPRVKVTGADINLTGEAGQIITMPFQALIWEGATTGGVVASTLLISDTVAGATQG